MAILGTKVTKFKSQKSISDFSKFAVTCIYNDKPLSCSDPMLLEIIKRAVPHVIQNQLVPRLVPERKGDETTKT